MGGIMGERGGGVREEREKIRGGNVSMSSCPLNLKRKSKDV